MDGRPGGVSPATDTIVCPIRPEFPMRAVPAMPTDLTLALADAEGRCMDAHGDAAEVLLQMLGRLVARHHPDATGLAVTNPPQRSGWHVVSIVTGHGSVPAGLPVGEQDPSEARWVAGQLDVLVTRLDDHLRAVGRTLPVDDPNGGRHLPLPGMEAPTLLLTLDIAAPAPRTSAGPTLFAAS